jgi:hypothetical protein
MLVLEFGTDAGAGVNVGVGVGVFVGVCVGVTVFVGDGGGPKISVNVDSK